MRQTQKVHPSLAALAVICAAAFCLSCGAPQHADRAPPPLEPVAPPPALDLHVPAEPIADEPLRVAVISDMNGSYGTTEYDSTVHQAIARVIALDPDVVLSTGDMVAGQRAGLDYHAMWASFHEAVSDPLAAAGLPFAISPGNHDASGYRAFEEERQIFVAEWSASRRPPLTYVDDEHFPRRYAFTLGGALFISLDATTVGPLAQEQMDWLLNVLEAHPAAVRIVFGHVPLYPFAVGREEQVIGDRRLEELLNAHQVDLFVSGHHHAYYPGKRGALRLVSMACLGGGPRPLIGEDEARGRSLLLFEIHNDRIEQLHAFGGPSYDQTVPRSDLPPAVGPQETEITRDDL